MLYAYTLILSAPSPTLDISHLPNNIHVTHTLHSLKSLLGKSKAEN